MKSLKKYITEIKNYYKRNQLELLLVFLLTLGFCGCVHGCNDSYKERDNFEKELSNYIGDSIIINNKLYIVVDYEMSGTKLILDNGNKINIKLIDKLK